MNPELPIDPRSALEASLTALLLGELPHDQAAALHQKLTQDAELAALYERLKHTINLVRETVTSPAAETVAQPAPVKLSDERRQKLLQQFKTVAPRQFVRRYPRPRRWLVPVGIAAGLIVILAVALPRYANRVALSSWVGTETDLQTARLAADTALSHAQVKSLDASRLQISGQRLSDSVVKDRLTDHYASAGEGHDRPTSAPPAPPAAPEPIEFAGNAIVLPQSSELAGTTPTPPAGPSAQAGWTASATLRGFYDDSLGGAPETRRVASSGRAGEVADATTTPSPEIAVGQGFAYKKGASGDSRGQVRSFQVGDANGEGGGGGVGGRAGAVGATPEGRPTEVAAVNHFYGQLQAGDVVKAGKPVNNDGAVAAFDLSSQAPATEERFSSRYGLAAGRTVGQSGTRGDPTQHNKQASEFGYAYTPQPPAAAGQPAAPEGRPATADGELVPLAIKLPAPAFKGTPMNLALNDNNELREQAQHTRQAFAANYAPTPLPATDAAGQPAAPVEVPPAVVAPAQQERLFSIAATPSAPVAAPAPTEGVTVTAGSLNFGAVPPQTHGEVMDAVVTTGLPSAPSRPSAEVKRGAEWLRESAAAKPRRPNEITSAGSYYGGYSFTAQARAGETAHASEGDASTLRQMHGMNGVALGVEPTKSKLSSPEQPGPKDVVVPLAGRPASRQAGEFAATDSWQDGVKGKLGEVAQDDHTTLGYNWYLKADNKGQTQAGVTPPSAALNLTVTEGQNLPVVGDLPIAGNLFRVKPNKVAAAGQAKVAEKFKGVDMAWSEDYSRQSSKAVGKNDGRTESGRNVYGLNVVGYANGAAPAAKAIPSARTELARRSSLPIALPSTGTESRLAFNDSVGNDQKARQFATAKQELAELQRFRQVLDAKIAYEKIDTELPKTAVVELVDKAVPASSPSSTLWDKVRGKGGTFKSTARIKVERDQSDIAGLAGGQPAAAYDPYFVQTESEVLRSEAVLGKVADELDLKNAWAGKNGAGDKLTTAETVELLRKSLDVQPVRNTGLLEIGVKSDKPEEAAKIANAVADAYRARRTEERSQLAKGGVKALEERYAEQEQKVREAQKKVENLRAQLNISDATAASDSPSPVMTADTLRRLEQIRIEGKAEHVRQTTLLDHLKKVQAAQGPEALAQVITVNAPDPLLASLLEQQTTAEQRLAELSKGYGPENPEVVKAKGQVADLHSRITQRVVGIMLGLETRVLSLSNSLDNLQQEVAKATSNDVWVASQTKPSLGAKSDAAPPKPAAPAPVPQPEVQTADNTFSTFSLNVSDVSWKLAAASLEKGVMPEPASVRSEEFINAFNYRDPEPPPGVPVAFAWERARYPFAQGRDLLRFSVKTAALGREPGRPLNLVLLLDNSGSMERADRVQIIREALRVLAAQLQPQDKFSIVTFSRTARLWVDGVPGNQAAKAAEEVSGLTPQGGTNLEEAMNLAYQTALRHYLANGVNRVVLLTDGAANLGNVDPEALKQKVEANRKQGIALDCFGIGWEGYNDDTLEALSRNGDGRYGFINTPEEAATEFAGQLAGALHVAASDVKVQVEFNPARVTAYRQIGYAKHQLTKEQFRDNTVDAAEIAAAESGNALYVIAVNPAGEGPLATVRVRYKVPGTSDYHEHEWPVPYTGNAVGLEQTSPAMRLAATASAFSEWLVSSPYAAEVSPDRLLGYLSGLPEVYGADARPKKLEWMIRQAKSIAGK